MPNDPPPSFDRLMDEVETLDSLLDDGPNDDSTAFLISIQDAAKQVHDTARLLTTSDVDAEFTEDEESEG